jgi:uncharacterized protein YbbC (DUF1343 family)
MQLGVDRLGTIPALLARLRGARLGVLCHAASVDRRLSHLLDVLADVGVTLRLVFAPEHGFGAAAQDMVSIGDEIDSRHGARVVSLYGDRIEDLAPQRSDLEHIDLLLVDLQDIGSRYYTFVWTALIAARAAAAVGIHTIVLDRPNPIGGTVVEGRSQEHGFSSFVGWERLPVRHGLTLGEMICLFAGEDGLPLGPDGAVSAVPVLDWSRSEARAWNRPWVLPSPNMPTFDTALVYPGGCLLEGTNLSEGRGHTRPFEVVGAPWLDGRALAQGLARTGLDGFVARPLTFIPTFHKHANKPCGGVQIHPTDASFRPVATYAALVALAAQQATADFRFRTERYEFVDDIPAFDLLTGSAWAREAIQAGENPRAIAEHLSQVDPAWEAKRALATERLARAAW